MHESFRTNTHVQGNYVDGGRPDVQDHDVTLVHRTAADDTFLRLATKDQVRTSQHKQAEEDTLLEHMAETVPEKVVRSKQTALWELKVNFNNDRKKWIAAAACNYDAFLAELTSRSEESEELAKALDVGQEGALEDFSEARKEVVVQMDAFRVFTEKEKERLESVVLDGQGGITEARRADITKQMLKESQEPFKGVLVKVRKAFTQLKAFLRTLQKSVDKGDKPVGGKRRPKQAPALAQLLVSLSSQEINVSTVNVKKELQCYYADGEYSAVILTGEKIDAWVAELSGHKYVTKQLVANKKLMAKNKQSFQVTGVTQKKVMTDMKRYCNIYSGSGEMLLHKVTTENSVACKAYEFEVVSYDIDYHSVNVPQYGLPEVRIYIAAEVAIIGIKIEAATGGSLRDKYATLYSMHVNDVLELAQRSGFVHAINTEEQESVLVIPADHIILEFTQTACDCIRWSFAPAADAFAGVSAVQTAIVNSFPEANSLVFQSTARLCKEQ